VKNEKSVFIVDPNPFARKGFTHLLRAGGYKISFYTSLNEFLEVYDSELKERCKNLSLVIVSEENPETRRIARALNASAYLSKPVDGPALLDTIEWTLRPDLNEKDLNNNKTEK
jgi:CheY-like chemotaxis protein